MQAAEDEAKSHDGDGLEVDVWILRDRPHSGMGFESTKPKVRCAQPQEVNVVNRSLLIRALLPLLLALAARPALAQNVLMNSAETINEGNFKIAAFPTVLFGDDDADDEWGVAARLGYGFTHNFDVEGKLAFFDGLKLYGIDAELWVVRHKPDISVALGIHKKDWDGIPDSTSLDAAVLVSGHIADRLELYAGLNLGRESVADSDVHFTRAYLVPGIEYKISEQLDLLAEFGVGLNDDSPEYLSFGLAFYIR